MRTLSGLVIGVAAGVSLLVGLFALSLLQAHHELDRRQAMIIDLRTHAIRLRAGVGTVDDLAIFRTLLRSNDSWERSTAAASVGQAGPGAAVLVGDLVTCLRDKDSYGTREAARALGAIGPAAREAIPSLTEAIRLKPDADIGWFAAQSLGEIADPIDPAVRECLERAATYPKYLLADSAKRGLKRLAERATTRPSTAATSRRFVDGRE